MSTSGFVRAGDLLPPTIKARLAVINQRIEDRERQLRTEHDYDLNQCPYCGNKGIPDANITTYCTCVHGDMARWNDERRVTAENRWQTTGIPKRFITAHISKVIPDNRDAAREIKDWSNANPLKSGLNLILSGAVGTGKTYLACVALRVLHDDYPLDARLAFATTIDVLRACSYGDHSDPEAVRRYKTVGCLAIDDLGAERGSPWQIEQLFDLIDSRYAAQLPTIATTNLDAPALRTYLGDRIADRLLDQPVFITVGA